MDWKNTLGTLAPTLATALGGPLAGAAAKFITGQLLGEESTDLSKVEELVLGANSETLASIKSMDHAFKVEMEKLGVDVFALEVDDKKDARLNHKLSVVPAVLSMVLTLIIAVLLYALFYV